MSFEPTSLIPIVLTAIGSGAVGVYAAKAKKDTDELAVVTSKDEIVLVHYDKIVDQLQEEVARLRSENEELRRHNMELEKSMLDMNKQVFELTKQLEELKSFVGLQARLNEARL
jgi:predicted RNase H-like nuclease (RuvC/YqgF family)